MNNEIERIILRKKSSSNLKISQRQKFKKHLLDLSIWNAICVWSLSEFNGSINRGGLTKMTEFKCLRIRRPRDRYRSGRRRSCAHIIGQFLTNWERPLFEVFLYAFSRFARGNRWIRNTPPPLFPLNGRPIPRWNSLEQVAPSPWLTSLSYDQFFQPCEPNGT